MKEIKDGKAVYSSPDIYGMPCREVETRDWEIDGYINYCLFPVFDCIKRMMGEEQEDGSEIDEYADILERLYDSAHSQLGKMCDAIHKDIGMIQIITTSEDFRGGFLKQEFLEAFVEKNQDPNRA